MAGTGTGGVARPGRHHDSDGDSHGPVPGLVRVTVAVTVEADTQAEIMSQSRLTSCRAAVGPGGAGENFRNGTNARESCTWLNRA